MLLFRHRRRPSVDDAVSLFHAIFAAFCTFVLIAYMSVMMARAPFLLALLAWRAGAMPAQRCRRPLPPNAPPRYAAATSARV